MEWSLSEYTPSATTTQSYSFPVNPDWYYASLRDAHTPDSTRASYQTLFATVGESEEGAIISRIPSTLELKVDTTTEIDFQQYFPSNKIARVEFL